MTPLVDSSSKINANDAYNTPQSGRSKLCSMECAAFLIIIVSLLLRLLCISYNNLLTEEAYYWNYAQHLDIGYLDHPPMVAFLIKVTTAVFGNNEFGVRIPSLLCWLLTAFYSFKLTTLMKRGSGIYAVMLLAILPFFFLQSLVITPDLPLISCWSVTLYCLYRSLILNESNYWYGAGIWLGLGLLSKYTIVLLPPAAFLYICTVPTARSWLTRKEPYLAALIAALLFSPVIYWNATHEWASFLFQSTRRLEHSFSFTFHYFLGLLVLFLMPPGLYGLWALLKKNNPYNINAIETKNVDENTKLFLRIFTLTPLIFFGIFSLSHGIKFNWIGPGLLALIPWLAINIQKSWLRFAVLLLLGYSSCIFVILTGNPNFVYQKLFIKFIAWDDITLQVNGIAKQVEAETKTQPIIAPLDQYNINSELTFYQTKLFAHHDITKRFPIVGRHIFGEESLMYRYWSTDEHLAGKTLIAISQNAYSFDIPGFTKQVTKLSPVVKFWSHSQVHGAQVEAFYYQVVKMKR